MNTVSSSAITQGDASKGAEVGASGRAPASAIFWDNKQRSGHSLHEVPYRACFKPELPAFFIGRHSEEGDLVYDPFMGRGTTLVQAWLQGRIPAGNDANPLSRLLVRPRLEPPELAAVQLRLATFDFSAPVELREDLLVFYHTETLRALQHLRAYFIERERTGRIDAVDRWLRMVAVTRLTGHSSGYFSVYTLPPNQAVTIDSQRRINERLHQAPEPRDVKAILLKKSRALLKDPPPKRRAWTSPDPAPLFTPTLTANDAAHTPELPDGSVTLIVTSPPFLDVVDYPTDNWLRMWFCGLDGSNVPWLMPRRVEDWEGGLLRCFREFNRVLKPGGHAAVEVGEVNKGRIPLEQSILRLGETVGWSLVQLYIQSTKFTKTAHCWGVTNNNRGTNSQRVALFRKPS